MEAARQTEMYLRQLGFYDPSEHEHDSVTFIGVGGIGSFAAYGAAKLGIPNITLIDPDEVEIHNVPNQMYTGDNVGTSKAVATAYNLCDQNDVDPDRITQIEATLPDPAITLSGVVVSGLDTMEARSEIWANHIKFNPRVPLYLDARLGGQIINLYAVRPGDYQDVEHYEKTLYSDDEAEDTSCTERGLIDVGLQVGSMITRSLRHHFIGDSIPAITIMNQRTLTTTIGSWAQ